VTGVPTEMSQEGGRRLASRIATHRVFDPLRGDGLKARALKGSAWTIAGFGSSQVLRLGSNLVLTRLLFPEAFGLMALVSVFMQGLAMFSDVGIGPSIIQNKRGEEPAFLNTAWTIQIVRGFILWAGAWALAWPVASFYGDPLLMQMLPVVGLTAAIQGFQSTAVFTSNRRLDLSRLTMLQLVGQAVSIAVMVTWAAIEPTVWALVAGGIASSIVQVGLGHVVLESHRHRIGWDRQASRSLFGFGKWIFLSTVFVFMGNRADRLFFGSLMGMGVLGMVAVAGTITFVLQAVVDQLGQRVLFPAMAQRQDLRPDAMVSLFSRARCGLLIASGIVLGTLVGAMPAVINILYDDRYAAAGSFGMLFAIGVWPKILSQSLGPALRSRGKPQYSAAANLATAMWIMAAVPAGFAVFGALGAVAASAFGTSVYYAVISFGLIRERLALALQDGLCTAAFVLAAVMSIMILN